MVGSMKLPLVDFKVLMAANDETLRQLGSTLAKVTERGAEPIPSTPIARRA
jgi:hypothetical protein